MSQNNQSKDGALSSTSKGDTVVHSYGKWIMKKSTKHGFTYYFDPLTGKSVWTLSKHELEQAKKYQDEVISKHLVGLKCPIEPPKTIPSHVANMNNMPSNTDPSCMALPSPMTGFQGVSSNQPIGPIASLLGSKYPMEPPNTIPSHVANMNIMPPNTDPSSMAPYQPLPMSGFQGVATNQPIGPIASLLGSKYPMEPPNTIPSHVANMNILPPNTDPSTMAPYLPLPMSGFQGVPTNQPIGPMSSLLGSKYPMEHANMNIMPPNTDPSTMAPYLPLPSGFQGIPSAQPIGQFSSFVWETLPPNSQHEYPTHSSAAVTDYVKPPELGHTTIPISERFKLINSLSVNNNDGTGGDAPLQNNLDNVRINKGFDLRKKLIAKKKKQLNLYGNNQPEPASAKPSFNSGLQIQNVTFTGSKEYKNQESLLTNLSMGSYSKDNSDIQDQTDDEQWLRANAYFSDDSGYFIDLTPIKKQARDNVIQDRWFLVADTNVFFTNLAFLDALLKSDETCCFIVAQRVCDELSVMSRGGGGSHEERASQTARRFLSHYLSSGRAITATDLLKSANDIGCANGDDQILNCCLRLVKLNYDVVFISNDKLLHRKTNMSFMRTYDVNELKVLLSSYGSVGQAIYTDEPINITINNYKKQNSDTNNFDLNTTPGRVVSHNRAILKAKKKIQAPELGKITTGQAFSVKAQGQTALRTSTKVSSVDFVSTMSQNNIKPPLLPAQNATSAKQPEKQAFNFNAMPNTDAVTTIGDRKNTWRRNKIAVTPSLSTPCSTNSGERESNYTSRSKNNELSNSFNEDSLIKSDTFSNDSYSNLRQDISLGNRTVAETSLSEISNSTSGSISLNASRYLMTEAVRADIEEPVMFEISDVAMEQRLLARRDEWVSRFTQIMEEALTHVLQQQRQNYDIPLTPPWTMHEAAQCIKKIFHSNAELQDATNKLSQSLFHNRDDKGNIDKNIKPKAFMELYSYGVYLIDTLQSILPDMEDIDVANGLLMNLVRDISDNSADANHDQLEPEPQAAAQADEETRYSRLAQAKSPITPSPLMETFLNSVDNQFNSPQQSENNGVEQTKAPLDVKFVRNIDLSPRFLQQLRNKDKTTLKVSELSNAQRSKPQDYNVKTVRVTNSQPTHINEPQSAASDPVLNNNSSQNVFSKPNVMVHSPHFAFVRKFVENSKFEEKLKNQASYMDGEYYDDGEMMNGGDEKIDYDYLDYENYDDDEYLDGEQNGEYDEECNKNEQEEYLDGEQNGEYDEDCNKNDQQEIDYDWEGINFILSEMKAGLDQGQDFCNQVHSELRMPVTESRRSEISREACEFEHFFNELLKHLQRTLDREDKEPNETIERLLKKMKLHEPSSSYREILDKAFRRAKIINGAIVIIKRNTQSQNKLANHKIKRTKRTK